MEIVQRELCFGASQSCDLAALERGYTSYTALAGVLCSSVSVTLLVVVQFEK